MLDARVNLVAWNTYWPMRVNLKTTKGYRTNGTNKRASQTYPKRFQCRMQYAKWRVLRRPRR